MRKMLTATTTLVFLPSVAEASSGADGNHHIAEVSFFIVILLLLARCGALVERLGLPSVLGELSVGAIAVLICRLTGLVYITDYLLGDVIVLAFAQFGVNLLLFKTGLEESVQGMAKVGIRAFVVAAVGVVCPLVLGWALSSVFFPESSLTSHIFVGATLVATSVGITAKIFQDLNYKSPTRTLVIGAAVADDIIGLLIFAVVAAMAKGTSVTAGMITGKAGLALAFIVGSVAIGKRVAPHVGRFFSMVHPGIGMKTAFALIFCFGFGWLAVFAAGLEPIIGAFCAGLLLEHAHFGWFSKPQQAERLELWMSQLGHTHPEIKAEMEKAARQKKHAHVEHLIEGLGRLFIPLFFIIVGTNVDLRVFADVGTLLVAACLATAAVLGKLVCGLVAGKSANRKVVAWAMVARGEVGLIFAMFGKAKGVFTDEVFAALVAVVVISTFIPPLILPRLIRQEKSAG